MRGHLRKIHERPKKAYRAGNTNVIRRDFLHEKGPFYNLASWHYVTSNWLAEMQIQLFARDWSRQRTPSSKASIGAWGTLVTWISNLIYMGLKFSTNFLLIFIYYYKGLLCEARNNLIWKLRVRHTRWNFGSQLRLQIGHGIVVMLWHTLGSSR